MLNASPLGKNLVLPDYYDPNLLFAIPRLTKRQELGIAADYQFYGIDIWNHYEVSWLNQRGKPEVALAEISYAANSPFIIESKSMKLYFNSWNNTRVSSREELVKQVVDDLTKAVGAAVDFNLIDLNHQLTIHPALGISLDDLDVECVDYLPNPNYLVSDGQFTQETLTTNLLKSNCLVTGQPDWGSLLIEYTGAQINHQGLLKYIVSLRNHNEFHEQCVERIFWDLWQQCDLSELTVYARYTRRGGLDINPYRTTNSKFTIPTNLRLIRQ